MELEAHPHEPPEVRRPAVRPWEALGIRLALGAVLAYGVGFWMVAMHIVEGGHESGEPPLLLHWLRDATLAFTPTVLAVLLATALSARALRAGDATPSFAWVVTASAAASATSIAFALGNPVHEALF